ncbi:MAG: type II toxin-antitoxin system prevent-host-death family antitoxin [Deltaproteobacteria bacterium]|nr:MAG: type II toxin-antitoxin system prevent-host-death family antitoxin [Deltaproteobacteria bacterium]
MQNVTIGEFKARFSHLLNLVKQGEEIVISYGRRKENVAVVIPYRREGNVKEARHIGILQGKAAYEIKDGFKLTEEEFLSR